jgi:hypothetical protein
MSRQIRAWAHDFMNLIFGHGEEKNHFWHTVLLPEVAQYYQVVIPEISSYYQDYPLEELQKCYSQNEIKYNALYFAVLDQIGLKCVSVEESKPVEKPKTKGVGEGQQAKKQYEPPAEEQFYKSFNRTEQPFGEFARGKKKSFEKRYEFEFVAKSRTYQFRNLPYTLSANRFSEFKNNEQIADAIECCRMRKCLKQWL